MAYIEISIWFIIFQSYLKEPSPQNINMIETFAGVFFCTIRLMSNKITEYKSIREAMHLTEKKLGIKYTYFSDPRLVRLQKDSKTHFIFGYLFDINLEAAAELANDKSAMYEVMINAGIAAVPHYILTSVLKPIVYLSDLVILFEKHKSLVIKPNGGNKGAMIAKFDNPEQALMYIEDNPNISW